MNTDNPTLTELKAFFADRPLPAQIQLYPWFTVMDVSKCVETSLVIIEHQKPGSWNGSFYDDLVAIKNYLESTST